MPLEQMATVLYDSTDTETGTVANPFTIDGTVVANQGTPAVIGNAWPMLVTDGVISAEVRTTAPLAGSAGLVVRIAGTVTTSIAQPSVGTVTSVALSTVVATILAANAARLGASIWNDGAANAYVRLGAGATTALFTARLANKSYYELQFPAYTGIITGITNAATATAIATELT